MAMLENWSIVMHPNACAYTAPEARSRHLSGILTGHPTLEDRTDIAATTSSIEAFSWEKRLARTRSGTLYVLGEPDPKWLRWIEESGHKLSDYDKGEL